MLSSRCHLSFEQKAKIYCLKNTLAMSFRQIAKRLGVSRSTAHYNFPNICNDIESIDSKRPDRTKELLSFLLNGVFSGNMSVRGVSAMIRSYFGQEISHQTLLSMLEECGKICKKLNDENSLDRINCAIFDEVFKKDRPILVMADPLTGLVRLKAAQDRKAESWASFLTELKEQGLKPKSTTTDGAPGLLKAIATTFSDAIPMRDLFHVLQKLSKAKRRMQGVCYQLIHEEDKTQDESVSKKCKIAIAIFDSYESSLKSFQKDSYLANPDTPGLYTSASELEQILYQCMDNLEIFQRKISNHKDIKDAFTYLENGYPAMIAYKKTMESTVTEVFGVDQADAILGHIMPIVAAMMQYQRSYESRVQKTFWGQKVLKLLGDFKKTAEENLGNIETALETCWFIIKNSAKSNSLIESVNSVIRVHLNTFKCIPEWFCEIFSFFWNHRVFSRGKRAGSSPIQQYEPNSEHSPIWVEKIFAGFPFHKFRSRLEPPPPLI
jgi:AcrR family transcriptional regulator